MQSTSVQFRKARPSDDERARYQGLRPLQKLLKKGSVMRPGAVPLPCDIILDQDVAVPLRDGQHIYVDIFRPAQTLESLPMLLAWSPYGKQGGVIQMDDLPFHGGVPIEKLSGTEMFEGPDPAFWCAHGYGVVNADARGAMSSQGNLHCWGPQEGQDGHDLVEWIAAQPWSNTKVGLTGTSWLAIVQWFIAAERPPHLAAFAPWEGWTDLYRCDVVRGGIPDVGFNNHMISMFAGPGMVEDIPAMVRSYPLMNSYWESKIPALDKVEVPAYVVSSWTNLIHTMGTLNGWRGVASKKKWLRVHNTHEWTDYYENVEDLRRFFDFYLKDAQNDWESTPKVRMCVLDPGGNDIVNRPEQEFPLARTHYTAMYLDATARTMNSSKLMSVNNAHYDPCDTTDRLAFVHRFKQDTEIAGYISLKLWVQALEADDLDIYVEVRKLDENGKHLGCRTMLPPGVSRDDQPDQPETKSGMIVFSGAKGMQRASMRATDAERSEPGIPHHRYDRIEKLVPGEIVPIEIQIWPLAMRWRKDEQLQLVIGGYKLSGTEFPGLEPPDTINRGRHVIHCGGPYDSHLLLPVT